MKNIIAVLPILFFSGCAYYQPAAVSSASIGSQYERPVGMAEGKGVRWYFFPCWALCPVGEASLKAALNDAVAGTPGDTLANVFVDRKITFFPAPFLPLIIKNEIIVTGTLVKYNTKEFPPDNDQLMNFRRVYKAEDLWPRLLELDEEEQQKIIPHLSDTARFNLKVFLENKENKKEIKEDSKESELFKLLLDRNVYQQAHNSGDIWSGH